MTPLALSRMALALPGAHEEPHFERTSFRVGKKIFATMTTDGSEAMVRVPGDGEIRGLLERHPDVFFSYGTWTTRNKALGVRVKQIDAARMQQLLTGSWKHVAPKKEVARFEATERGSADGARRR